VNSQSKHRFQSLLERSWYGKTFLTQILRPLSWLFIAIVSIRQFFYRHKILKSTRMPVPVIVVGNLTVGGTGKTPLVIWLAEYLKSAGFRPGVLSRGYGGKAKTWPQQVRPDADPVVVGDEAVVIARRTSCPMAVGPDRVSAGLALLKYSDCDVIISDDGLQHYALQRDIEIMVIDGTRRFGNGYCLPAGPLRELKSRKDEVDFKVTSGVAAQGEYPMIYKGKKIVNLLNSEARDIDDLKEKAVVAIAGIGNPDRFFNYLRTHGMRLDTRSYPDHFQFTEDSISAPDDAIVLMTEKDAVKCQRYAKPNWWYVPVDAKLPKEFGLEIINSLGKRHG
jgi:tetraacyldisaccharide 4'-kinase